jgi:DNA-binding transcriptional MerR regulator
MIPNKSNFKFTELTPITGVKPYVIRFWETEFPDISPITSDSGQKLYSRKDVDVILKIKELLFDQKMSIPEAKQAMTNFTPEAQALVEAQEEVSAVKDILTDALQLIKEIKHERKW